MTTEEVKALPVDEKIRMMEAIWEDFRERFDRMEIPQEQKDLLDQRRTVVREGKARLLDWDSGGEGAGSVEVAAKQTKSRRSC